MSIYRLIRQRFFPHLWCPGCGHGMVLNSLLHAVDDLGIDQSQLCMVSGIGCSARISGYVDFHSMHTLHGRALAFATGLKMARPELKVFVPMGDGDATAIGGNHFIHACRRNIDMVAIVMNNRIYGMTGGQYSPLSGRQIGGDDEKSRERSVFATTAPYGSIDRAFDTVELAKGAGATFVARTTAYHVQEMRRLFKQAYEHKGFSVVEVLCQCPTYFGRKNKMGGAVQMLQWLKDNTEKLGSKKLEENPNLIARGVFVDKDEPEYCSEYENSVIAKAHKE
ncbi:MAG: 2-oxoacid:ferredoxin oxidoreductase subunit beta [Desulfovibrionaceae bacterium]|nr:2-oxoacid:ferredoxin oxidoreductase subunit beta [Desulfovibrionaceae bacterium]MBR5734092.1 2-oxoacid:ferredoxin oxidoreductase subunit beta [Desulfovibrionaceae bacterium]